MAREDQNPQSYEKDRRELTKTPIVACSADAAANSSDIPCRNGNDTVAPGAVQPSISDMWTI
jgi:hypothetical protein